ncbi:GIY-YIG nuclease family protein [Candidatus Parcubacteria bacterium]|nr:GIY-YIG nuclease family protein [Candidatus Parcubacteria bacterium]
MYYVYILKSLKDKKLYIGYTSNLFQRVKEHNSSKNKSTKYRVPFKLVYYEAYQSQLDANKRESNLKLRAKASIQLFRRIRNSLAS